MDTTTTTTETKGTNETAEDSRRRLSATRSAGSPVDVEAEAEFWRAKYQEERERLAKLWVAYKDLEAELDSLQGDDGTPAEPATAPAASDVDEDPETDEADDLEATPEDEVDAAEDVGDVDATPEEDADADAASDDERAKD